MKLFSIVVYLAAFCGGAQSAKVLALLENLDFKDTHSMYFKRLTDAGQEVTYKVADDPSIVIKKDDNHLYDHLVIFSPTVEKLGGSLSVEAIVEFINDGGNVMMAGSSRGGGVITDHESLRVLDVLTGCSFSYSHNPEDPITEYPNATGKNAEHIAGLQDRNNARVIFAGSMDLFSDEMFSSLVEKAGSGAHGVPSGNADRAKALSAWCFQMSGVVRIASVESFTAMKEFLLARISSILGVAIMSFLVQSIIRANHLSKLRSFFLPWILLISIPLFWNSFEYIPVPKLVLLGAILISSGLLLLLPGPFLPFQQSLPTIIIIFMIVGASQGAFMIARLATSFVSVPWVLKSLGSFDSFLGIVFGMWLSAAITFDKAIFVLIGMEVVSMLLVLI